MQSATGGVTVFGADFQQYQKVGYPIVGNQSFASADQAVSDANGAFTFKFQLSDMPSGTYIVRMSGAIQATVPLVISPELQLIPDSGHVGQSVVAKLTGFASRATVAVSWGSGQAMSARASVSGTAMVIISVPGLSYGPHTVYANSIGLGAETTFTLNTSSVVLSKYGASPGSTVYAYAEGFDPSAEVHLLYQGRVSGVAERTLGNGTAVIPFVVPEMTAGTYSMQASSTDGMQSNVTVFVVKPTILSSTESLHVGAAVQISGRFYYPLTGIKVYVGNTIVPDTFKSNQNGTFYANITIPAVPGGQVALGAYDLEGNNATLFMLNIMPEIYLNTQSGSTGSVVTVTGYGFAAGRDVTILWNGNPIQAVSSVGANGTFTATLAVPSGVPGTYLVSVANSTAEPIVFNLVQYTGFEAVLPAILLPLVTAIGISLYLFRKFRVMSIGGALYPVHMAVSSQWKVHYFSSDMAENASCRKEEEVFLNDFSACLGSAVVSALEAVGRSLGLDYCGMDFGIDRDGRLLLYEANATMSIVSPTGEEKWDYKRLAIANALMAAKRMFAERLGNVQNQLPRFQRKPGKGIS
jgi:hypothetical protein